MHLTRFAVAIVLFPVLFACPTPGWGHGSGSTQELIANANAQPGLSSQAPSVNESFARLREELSRPAAWGDLLKSVARVVDQHRGDPGAKLQALEFLADVLPEAEVRYRRTDGMAWSEFCQEYANQLANLPLTNGTSDTQWPIRFGDALQSVAKTLAPLDSKTSAQLLLQVGRVARNLHANPAYPRPAIAGLAPLLMSEARGHAARNDGVAAQQSIQLALEWGLVDFEEIYEDETLVACPTGDQIKRLVSERQKIYEQQVRTGVAAAVREFRAFPFDFSLPTLGEHRRAKSHFAGKLTVVDIWGTWCKPCRASLPHLARLQSEYASRGVQIVGIAMEQQPTVAEIQVSLREFVAEHGITYEILVGNDAVMEQLPGGGQLPTLLFLDEAGRVRFATSGYRDYTQLKTIVEQLLNETPAPTR